MAGYIAGAQLGVSYTASDLTSGIGFGIGDVVSTADGKRYRFYQYNTAAGVIACVAGNVVGFYAPGGVSAGATTVVTSDVSDTAGVLAGVAQAAVGNGEYGWFQVWGEATITPALVSGADGNALTLSSTTDGTLKVVGAVTDAGGAKAIDASAKIIYVNC